MLTSTTLLGSPKHNQWPWSQTLILRGLKFNYGPPILNIGLRSSKPKQGLYSNHNPGIKWPQAHSSPLSFEIHCIHFKHESMILFINDSLTFYEFFYPFSSPLTTGSRPLGIPLPPGAVAPIESIKCPHYNTLL